jgi:hypothetical protein
MYSLASLTTSLLGAKFSRRSVASTSRTLLSRLALEEASRRLGGAVVVFINDRIRQAVFALLHSPPLTYGINRTTWKMADMQEILRTQGYSLSRHLIRAFIEEAGYKWRKARMVLTSRDPNYQTKVDGVY